jgi:hypothetical protein
VSACVTRVLCCTHVVVEKLMLQFPFNIRCNGNQAVLWMRGVSCRPLTAEARVRSWASPCRISGVQDGTATGFSRTT